MNITAILIGLALFGIAVPFIVKPFRQQPARKTKHQITNGNGDGRIAVLSALRDLDFDYKVGKVSEEDYVPTREQLLVEAARYMEQQDEKEYKLEDLIRKRRASIDVSCSECGTPMESDQRFCSKCGSQANKVDCPACGEKVRASDLFCSTCGSQIQVQMEAVQP